MPNCYGSKDAIIWARQNDIKIIVAMIKCLEDDSFTNNVVPYDLPVYLNRVFGFMAADLRPLV